MSFASTVPTLEVKPRPDSSTEYSTPQPELPHVCLPQPSKLDAVTDPTLDVVLTPVKDATDVKSRFGEPTEDVVESPVTSTGII
jgi:hypothetical protein